jgi:hypothetical protein
MDHVQRIIDYAQSEKERLEQIKLSGGGEIIVKK